MPRRWQATILGEPASKANSRRIGRNPRTRKMMSRKSEKAEIQTETAQIQLAFLRARPLLKGRLKATATVYYRTERPDLDIEILFDTMQGYVYQNDRQVREKHLTHAIDRDNPRIEIVVEELGIPR
jgi:Holliday junction resolvase RusA-like endonuclease